MKNQISLSDARVQRLLLCADLRDLKRNPTPYNKGYASARLMIMWQFGIMSQKARDNVRNWINKTAANCYS